MSSAVLGTLEQQQEAKRLTSADALEVFAALANQDRLTDSLAAEGCLAAARLVCRQLRDLVDGGVKSIKLAFTHEKVDNLEREQTLAALLHRWDRCQGLTVELCGDWGNNAALNQAMPQWLFSGVTEAQLLRIQTFTLSTGDMQHWYPDLVPLLSTLAARMPSLRRLDLSGRNIQGDWRCCEGFYTALAASCPRLETLGLPWHAPLPGVEALAGSLVQLSIEVGALYHIFMALTDKALRSISLLEHLRELSVKSLALWDYVNGIAVAGPDLLRLLDSLPLSLETLKLEDVQEGNMQRSEGEEKDMRFFFRGGRLQSVDVTDGRISCGPLQSLAHALLRCRAAGPGVGTDPQQLRPSLRIQEVVVRPYDQPFNIPELGDLRERFSLAALDAIILDSRHRQESQNRQETETMAACAGSIVSVFGLPKELRDLDARGCNVMQLGRRPDARVSAGARAEAATATARTVEVVHEGSTVGMGSGSVPLASAAAAAPSPHGGSSSQTGGSAAPVVLKTAGVEDVMQAVAERLWADTDTSGAAGGQAPGPASPVAGGQELGRFVVLHGPCRTVTEWRQVMWAVAAKLRPPRPQEDTSSPPIEVSEVMAYNPPVRWALAGPQFLPGLCLSSDTAVKVVAIASSPDGPCAREGIRARRLRVGAIESAVESVLLELWHGSATSGPIMSQERRLERLVELRLVVGAWCRGEQHLD